MAECACLESRYTLTGIVSSNLTPSALLQVKTAGFSRRVRLKASLLAYNKITIPIERR